MAHVSNLRCFQAPNQEELAELLKLGLPTKLGIRATVVVANPHFATVKFSKTFSEFFFFFFGTPRIGVCHTVFQKAVNFLRVLFLVFLLEFRVFFSGFQFAVFVVTTIYVK